MCLVAWLVSLSQAAPMGGLPLATQDRLRNPGWWPTKGTIARSEYRGPAACASCHSAKAAMQIKTPMARAAAAASDAELLRDYPSLTFLSGTYRFEISTTANGSTYSVTEGTESRARPLQWVFGNGEVGQTYVFKRDSSFFESRVSFYPALQALDLTLGHQAPSAGDLDAALGRPMASAETRLCFGCHTTASTTGGRFDETGLIPGVTCEACHGPGSRHMEAIGRKQFQSGLRAILNPASLNPVDSVDFCGACHRTVWDVALTNTRGVANVRFQPYRLEKSRCWGKGDRRLTCIACHDPHQPLARDPAAYDDRCLRCHVSGAGGQAAVAAGNDPPGKACPVATTQCVRCHMAKYEIPGSHAQFTDHWIRVVKANAPYPD
jgi:hypothetical protein